MRKRKTKKRKTKAKIKRTFLAAAAVLLVVFVLSPFSKYLVSLGVMSVYSGLHGRDSIMQEKGIELSIPGGAQTAETDWYPFVMTFNPSAESFCRFTGETDRRLTILYNFPAFDLRWGKGCSRLYDVRSPYYNAFYGAYLVTEGDATKSEPGMKSEPGSKADFRTADSGRPPFGFDADGNLDLAKTGLVPQYDFEKLVLGDFGIAPRDMQFDWSVRSVRKIVEFLGYEGWTCVDADLTVSGAFHRAHGFRQSYLQYGTPKYDAYSDDPFTPVNMRGRVYARYFPQWNSSIFFYVMAPSQDVIDRCDREILQKSKLQSIALP